MSRDWRLWLADVVEYADAALGFVRGMTREDFEADLRTSLAVHRALEIVGEAVRNVPADVRARAAAAALIAAADRADPPSA